MEIGQLGSAFPLSRSHFRKDFSVSLSKSKTSSFSSEKRMFILGMGFVGQSLARKLHNQGWVVSGTCTNHVKKKQLEKMGFDVYLFDANHPELKRTVVLQCEYTTTTEKLHSLSCFYPPVVGIDDLMLQREELLRSSLVNADLQWLCYLSSTTGGTMEIVVNGTTGLLHPVGKEGVTPLAKNIVNLATHVERRLTMGRKGYERVKEQFLEPHMAQRIALVLKEVLRKGSHK